MKKQRTSRVRKPLINKIDQRKAIKKPLKGRRYPFKFYFGIASIMFAVGFPLYLVVHSLVKNHQLTASRSKTTRGVVIDEKNFTGHSPVKHQFFYSYQFLIKGKAYKGNTNNSKFDVGDSVFVRYAKSNPSFNEIITP
jgi:hypothetical protein